MRTLYGCTLVMIAALLALSPAWSQQKTKTIQGKVVKVQPSDNLIIIQNSEGQEVRVLVNERARLSWNEQPVRVTDLAVGHQLSVAYELDNDRYLAHAIIVIGPAELAPPLLLKGTVVRVLADPNLLVIRMADGKETAITLTQDTTIRVGNRDVRLVNVTPGMEVTVAYHLRAVATAVNIPAATVPASTVPAANVVVEPTIFRGKIVKVLGTDNAFIIKDDKGKEVRFLVDDRSVLRLKDKQAKLVDFREDMIVAVGYTTRGDQYVVTTLEPQAAVIAAPIAGKIRGQVLEGDRPQPDLPVDLLGADGKILATVRTLPTGVFEFDNIAPGGYTLSAVKEASQTKGVTRVTVQPNTVTSAVINLMR